MFEGQTGPGLDKAGKPFGDRKCKSGWDQDPPASRGQVRSFSRVQIDTRIALMLSSRHRKAQVQSDDLDVHLSPLKGVGYVNESRRWFAARAKRRGTGRW
jgi:hypothetical protein